jgi:hypothetical protein
MSEECRTPILERRSEDELMSDNLLDELPSIPDAASLEYRDVLAAYAQAMAKVQLFEFILKHVFNLHRMIPGSPSAPEDDSAFERMIRSLHTTTLGQALKGLRDFLASTHAPDGSPDLAKSGLDELVKVRNFLAHHYLFDRAALICMPEARDDLLAELRHYARLFTVATEGFLLWCDELLPIFGISAENSTSRTAQVEANLQEVARSGLEELRKQLRAMGAIE